MKTYTIRLFYPGIDEFQESQFEARSETEAYNLAVRYAEENGAAHFNINLEDRSA